MIIANSMDLCVSIFIYVCMLMPVCDCECVSMWR